MDFLKMMQAAQQVSGKMRELQESLQRMSVTGSAGGGLVTVTVDGRGTMQSVRLDPATVQSGDVEMLEDLVAVATQDAQRKAREQAEAEMQRLAGGLGLGNLPFSLPF
ncbi:MAG: YbaB/EbfC family nucleoid-associated protein [Gemmatimonadaceae bacterium]